MGGAADIAGVRLVTLPNQLIRRLSIICPPAVAVAQHSQTTAHQETFHHLHQLLLSHNMLRQRLSSRHCIIFPSAVAVIWLSFQHLPTSYCCRTVAILRLSSSGDIPSSVHHLLRSHNIPTSFHQLFLSCSCHAC